MKDLHGITGVPSCFFAIDGTQLATTGWQHVCTSSCCLIPHGLSLLCCDGDTLARLECGASVMMRCPGGFEMIVAPVCLECRTVAFFLDGPLSCQESRELHVRDTPSGAVPFISQENGARHLARASTFAGLLSMCITHSFQLVQEIDERKWAESRLQHSEDLYRTIFEHSGTAMAIVRANISFGALFGIDQKALPETSWTFFLSLKGKRGSGKYMTSIRSTPCFR